MPNSIITKQALAASLRKLITEEPFEKISVAEICEGCNMNRKSFYYQFQDKYDLVNWIFDMDFMSFIQNISSEDNTERRLDIFAEICKCFYDNRSFYRYALKINGQNSLTEHLREYCEPVIENRLNVLSGTTIAEPFYVEFFTEAIMIAIVNWITRDNPMTAEEFVEKISNIIRKIELK